MPLNLDSYPYGMSDLKLTSLDGLTQVDLPSVTKLGYKVRIKSAEGVGDDKISTVVAVIEAVEWELEATGLPVEALALMHGLTTDTTGTTPNQVKTLNFPGAVRLPYFKIYGKSIGDGDDDVHVKMFKCKVTEGLDAPQNYGELQKSTIKGIAIDDGTNGVMDVIQNETAAALPGS